MKNGVNTQGTRHTMPWALGQQLYRSRFTEEELLHGVVHGEQIVTVQVKIATHAWQEIHEYKNRNRK